jgi:hypothetical protein
LIAAFRFTAVFNTAVQEMPAAPYNCGRTMQLPCAPMTVAALRHQLGCPELARRRWKIGDLSAGHGAAQAVEVAPFE